MDIGTWIKAQPKEVQDEFNNMEFKQREIDNREMAVSQIYYGNKPVSKDTLELIKYSLSILTDKQKEVYRLYHEEKKTQQEVADILGIGQRAVSWHILAIKQKIEKII